MGTSRPPPPRVLGKLVLPARAPERSADATGGGNASVPPPADTLPSAQPRRTALPDVSLVAAPPADVGTRLVTRRGIVLRDVTPPNVIDLARERMRRNPAEGEACVAAGDAFMFETLDTVKNRVGIIQTAHPIVISGGAGLGFAMTVETAKALIVELQSAIKSPLLPK